MALYDDDVTDNLSGKDFRSGKSSSKTGAVIQFYHVPTIKAALKAETNDSQATFKAFLVDFKDNYKVNWNAKETFGRMDAIQTYKNTQRTITLSFDVPSNSSDEAVINFLELQKLITMQYPVYETVNIAVLAKPPQSLDRSTATGADAEEDAGQSLVDGTSNDTAGVERDLANNNAVKENTTAFQEAKEKGQTARFMSSPPLLYINFMNWINDGNSGFDADTISNVGDALVGIVSEVNFSPDLDQGFHFMDSKLVPKLFSVNLNITVIHTSELGWSDTVAVSNQKLSNRVFGQPKFEAGSEKGFADYPYFPYSVGNIVYEKK